MMKFFSLVLIAGVAVPASAQTVAAGQAASAGGSVKARDPNRIICERQEDTGSRLGGKKVCKTAAQWDEERRANREAVDGWQRQPGSGPPNG